MSSVKFDSLDVYHKEVQGKDIPIAEANATYRRKLDEAANRPRYAPKKKTVKQKNKILKRQAQKAMNIPAIRVNDDIRPKWHKDVHLGKNAGRIVLSKPGDSHYGAVTNAALRAKTDPFDIVDTHEWDSPRKEAGRFVNVKSGTTYTRRGAVRNLGSGESNRLTSNTGDRFTENEAIQKSRNTTPKEALQKQNTQKAMGVIKKQVTQARASKNIPRLQQLTRRAGTLKNLARRAGMLGLIGSEVLEGGRMSKIANKEAKLVDQGKKTWLEGFTDFATKHLDTPANRPPTTAKFPTVPVMTSPEEAAKKPVKKKKPWRIGAFSA